MNFRRHHILQRLAGASLQIAGGNPPPPPTTGATKKVCDRRDLRKLRPHQPFQGGFAIMKGTTALRTGEAKS